MTTLVRILQRLLPSPSINDVTFSRRGFPTTDKVVTRALEQVPLAVVAGFECAATVRSQEGIVRRLDLIDAQVRPLAYEGAITALILRDIMSPRRTSRARRFVDGPAAPYVWMAYLGYGFLFPRIPRLLWQRMLPDFGEPHHRVLNWLAVDGYAFDRAYFDTERWVDRQYVPPAYPWQGDGEYFLRVVDQGIGRALLWTHCGDHRAIAATVERFAAHRRADLWSGIGTVVTYAPETGLDAEALRSLLATADGDAAQLALGSALGVKARHLAGPVHPRTEMAAAVLTGLTVEKAVALVDDAAEEVTDEAMSGGMPGYERWRLRIRKHFDEHLPSPAIPR